MKIRDKSTQKATGQTQLEGNKRGCHLNLILLNGSKTNKIKT